MSNIVAFPKTPKPIPIHDTDEPHTVALKTLDMWIDYASKHCVPGWAEKAISDRLWRIRARSLFTQNGDKS
jgi:hypothetical protein